MEYKIHDLHVVAIEPLFPPRALKQELPVDDGLAKFVYEARDTIRDIVHGRDLRLLCVVGPCSIHDPNAALDYAERLSKLQRRVGDELYLVMRVYFEKPRTTVGWKGLINDPLMDDSCNVELGLRTARRLLLDINRLGVPVASEMLDPITPQYIADLVSWAAIGARTSESQVHRQMASGLSMAVGFKNSTDGNLQIAVNAVESARRPHSFFGITQDGVPAVVRTSGNPDTHVVLRGGSKAPNYDRASIMQCAELLRRAGLTPRVMVDCSHAQTNKDYTRQPAVLNSLIEQIRDGSTEIMGVMLESNIFAGNQKPSRERDKLKYGVSVTDPCIDWETTERCLLKAAEVIASVMRRRATSAERVVA